MAKTLTWRCDQVFLEFPPVSMIRGRVCLVRKLGGQYVQLGKQRPQNRINSADTDPRETHTNQFSHLLWCLHLTCTVLVRLCSVVNGIAILLKRACGHGALFISQTGPLKDSSKVPFISYLRAFLSFFPEGEPKGQPRFWGSPAKGTPTVGFWLYPSWPTRNVRPQRRRLRLAPHAAARKSSSPCAPFLERFKNAGSTVPGFWSHGIHLPQSK